MSIPTDAREQARHSASVMIAFAEGKSIRSRFKTYPHPPWIDDTNPRWDFVAVEYEVKPEERKPREIYLIINTDGSDAVVFRKHDLDDEPETLLPGYEIVKFREVLPETETES